MPLAVRGRVGLVVQVAQGTQVALATPAAGMADMALGGMSLVAPVVMAVMGLVDQVNRVAPVSPAVRDPGGQASRVGTNRVVLMGRGRVVQGRKVRDRQDRAAQVPNPDQALRDLTPTLPERADRDPMPAVRDPIRADPRPTRPHRRREQTVPAAAVCLQAGMRPVEAIPRVEAGPLAVATHRRFGQPLGLAPITRPG